MIHSILIFEFSLSAQNYFIARGYCAEKDGQRIHLNEDLFLVGGTVVKEAYMQKNNTKPIRQ